MCGRRDMSRIDNAFGAFDKNFVYGASQSLGFTNIANCRDINKEYKKRHTSLCVKISP